MNMSHKKALSAALVAGALAVMGTASAQTVRIGNQGDALSMDPHSLNESLQLSVTGNVYEPLVGRNKDLSLAPALATGWMQTSPTVWRFELRRNVLFHIRSIGLRARHVAYCRKRWEERGGCWARAQRRLHTWRRFVFAVELVVFRDGGRY